MKKIITLIALILVITISEAQTWTTLTSGSTSNFKSIHFPTSSVGFVSGDNGTILKTNDGGTIWQSTTSSFPGYWFWDVHFLNADTGFVVGESNPGTNPAGSGIILKTTDGGLNWTTCVSGLPYPVRDLFVLNNDTVFACGGAELTNGKIIKSVYGGLTWNQIGITWFDGMLGGLYFLNSNVGFLGVYESSWGAYNPSSVTWLNTTNGGGTFTSNVISGSWSYWNFSTDFPNQLTGYMSRSAFSTDPVYIRKTIDGGNNWTENAIPGFSGSIYGLDFITTDTGYVVGGSGVIMKTNDGGSSWVSENSGVTDDLRAVYFINDALGFAAGSNGKILKRTSNTTGIAANYFADESLNVYPNPFNASTTISYSILKAAKVELTILDLLGNKIATVDSDNKSAGNHSTIWNTETVAEGMYTLQLKVDNQISSKKIIITK